MAVSIPFRDGRPSGRCAGEAKILSAMSRGKLRRLAAA
jgi:hypothetical protein